MASTKRLPGQYYDEETGLHYNYARYYDSSIGRYITSDPIGLLGGSNTYGYVLQNPLIYSDHLGLCPAGGLVCVPASIAIAAAVRSAIFYGSAAIAGWWAANNWVDDPDAAREHDEYKDRYAEPPPPGLDECELLKWKLEREKRLLQDRQTWDANWSPGSHDEAIKQSKNAIRNLEKKIKQVCKDQCE